MIQKKTMIFLLIALATILINIGDAGYYWYKTGDAKPFIESTVGEAFASGQAVRDGINRLTEMKQDYLDNGTKSSLTEVRMIRMNILLNTLFFLLFWWLLYGFLKWIMLNLGGTYFDSWVSKAVLFFIAGLLIVILEFGYVAYTRGLNAYEGVGIWSLIKDLFTNQVMFDTSFYEFTNVQKSIGEVLTA